MTHVIAFLIASGLAVFLCAYIYNDVHRYSSKGKVVLPYYYTSVAWSVAFGLFIVAAS